MCIHSFNSMPISWVLPSWERCWQPGETREGWRWVRNSQSGWGRWMWKQIIVTWCDKYCGGTEPCHFLFLMQSGKGWAGSSGASIFSKWRGKRDICAQAQRSDVYIAGRMCRPRPLGHSIEKGTTIKGWPWCLTDLASFSPHSQRAWG